MILDVDVEPLPAACVLLPLGALVTTENTNKKDWEHCEAVLFQVSMDWYLIINWPIVEQFAIYRYIKDA